MLIGIVADKHDEVSDESACKVNPYITNVCASSAGGELYSLINKSSEKRKRERMSEECYATGFYKKRAHIIEKAKHEKLNEVSGGANRLGIDHYLGGKAMHYILQKLNYSIALLG